MKHRYDLLPLLLLLVVAVSPALAARPVPVPERIEGPVHQLNLAQPNYINETCLLGVPGAPAYGINYINPPEDAYYTLLDPEQCGCSATGVFLGNAHLYLYYPSFVCSSLITVSVVGADLTNPECPVPAPGVIICNPVTYLATPPSAGVWDYCLPLDGVCVTSKAFLKIQFENWGTCTEMPHLVIGNTDCQACVSWNGYPPSSLDELCGVGMMSNPLMWVESLCCDVVPAHGTSWGRIKTLYR